MYFAQNVLGIDLILASKRKDGNFYKNHSNNRIVN